MDHKPLDGQGIDPLSMKITSNKLIKCDETFNNMADRLQEMRRNGNWNKTSVKEQSQRIRELTKKRKERMINLLSER